MNATETVVVTAAKDLRPAKTGKETRTMFGPGSTAVVTSRDVQPPGAPTIAECKQISNRQWDLTIMLPEKDSDGSPLTGLRRLVLLTAPALDGVSPFSGTNYEADSKLPGVVMESDDILPLDIRDGYALMSAPVLNLGGPQAFAVYASDEAAAPADPTSGSGEPSNADAGQSSSETSAPPPDASSSPDSAPAGSGSSYGSSDGSGEQTT